MKWFYMHGPVFVSHNVTDGQKNTILIILCNAVVPLPDFLKIGSSAEIREVGIEKIIKK